VHWKRITLIGVGLLGGSLGLALKRRRLAGSVVGYVRRAVSIRECVRAGAVDSATLELAEAVTEADLVVLCTPLAQMRPLVQQMLPALKPGAIVTDVGSVKGSVVRELESIVSRAGGHFVGSHPMAGAEKTGVAAARVDLFENAICVTTPTSKTNRTALRKVERLWKSIGCRLLRLTPEVHDELVSRSSHLPHVVAAGLANLVLRPGGPAAQAMLCANGFRDTTRIASGSPEMWRDIALANRRNLAGAVERLITDLRDFRCLLKGGDGAALQQLFEQAKQRRDKWSRQAAPNSPE
jgi:prephenate dehydrogenase